MLDLRVEDGKFIIDGYPEGSSIHIIEGNEANELRRLYLFRSDLHHVLSLVQEINTLSFSSLVKDAIARASVLKLCNCFEGTRGFRTKPLSKRRVFNPSERGLLKVIVALRNKVIAHDEHLNPMEVSAVVIAADGSVIEALVIGAKAMINDRQEFDYVEPLAKAAYDWVAAEYERVASNFVAYFRSLPLAERLEIKSIPATINIIEGPPLTP